MSTRSHENQPRTLFIRTTENCNAGCFMCGYANKNGEPFMSEEQLCNIVSEAKKAGIKLIRFTGGETLLHKDISKYIAYIKAQGIQTSIITNGYLLPNRVKSLIEAGLDQVIVSIDGSSAELHNELRNLNKLFERAIKGIIEIKKNSDILVRINTVVSPQNVFDLKKMIPLLQELDVDQWSIIPLKSEVNLWQYVNRDEFLTEYLLLTSELSKIQKPRLLGFSAQWAGRNEEEVEKYFTTGIPFTPRAKCNLVDKVRFYIPQGDHLLACNCVPWRLENIQVETEANLLSLNDNSLKPLVDYLHKNGPQVCKGCEPNNAYLGENPDILEEDIFSY